MRRLTVLSLLLVLLFVKINADWLPSSNISLGIFPEVKAKGMYVCRLENGDYVSAYQESPHVGAKHFIWKESGFKSEIKNHSSGHISNLLCLKNGKYLLLTGSRTWFRNSTFAFFDSNGEKTHSFDLNETFIEVEEMLEPNSKEGKLLVYSPKLRSSLSLIGFISILEQSGALIKRKEFTFNFPQEAFGYYDPWSWTKIRAFPDNNDKIYLVTFNGEWITSNGTLYAGRTFYNISVLDQNLSTISGPVQMFAPKTDLEFTLKFLGSDKFVMVDSTSTSQNLNITFFSKDLILRSSDFLKTKDDYYLNFKIIDIPDGFILVGRGDSKVTFWQKYYYNEARKGSLNQINSSLIFHADIQLKNEEDIGWIYSGSGSNEVFFTRASNFIPTINSAYNLSHAVIIMFILCLVLIEL